MKNDQAADDLLDLYGLKNPRLDDFTALRRICQFESDIGFFLPALAECIGALIVLHLVSDYIVDDAQERLGVFFSTINCQRWLQAMGSGTTGQRLWIRRRNIVQHVDRQ
jgi:hypothetical protein